MDRDCESIFRAASTLRPKAAALLLEVYSLSLLIGCRAQQLSDLDRMQERADTLAAAQVAAYVQLAEAKYNPTGMTEDERSTVWPVAQWLGCLGRTYSGITDEDKALACWVVYNRMSSPLYPAEALDVLQEHGQFAEFDPTGEAMVGDLEIALEEYRYWADGSPGGRPCSPDAVFLAVDANGLSVRDNYNATRASVWRARGE